MSTCNTVVINALGTLRAFFYVRISVSEVQYISDLYSTILVSEHPYISDLYSTILVSEHPYISDL